MFNLRKMLEGAVAQANVFDGGKTYASVNRSPAQKIARGAALGVAGAIGGSADNQITNRMVAQGRLPQSQAEIYQQRPQLRVQQSSQMQPFGQGYEDEQTPLASLQNQNYGFNPQTTRNAVFEQNANAVYGGMQAPQNSGAYDAVEQIRRRLGLF